ncbi:MAG: succinate dehydrogenase cytochrome b558 subunit [Phycisphaerales bacterium]
MENGQSFWQRNYHVLRRLHSLTGIVPIGLFLIIHLTTNSSVMWGALNGRSHVGSAMGRGVETFQEEVSWINSLPLLLLIEIFGLWVPIAFHAILGVAFALSGSNNVARYGFQGNKRYVLQRLTGYIGFVFILYHVATLRWGWEWLTPSDTAWSHYFATSTLAAALKGDGGQWTMPGMIVSIGYFIGVTALVFHFANGLLTASITWGVLTTEKARRRWGYACTAIGAAVMLAGWSALLGFVVLVDYDEARAIEVEVVKRKYGAEYLEQIQREYLHHPSLESAAIRRAADAPFPGPAPMIRE